TPPDDGIRAFRDFCGAGDDRPVGGLGMGVDSGCSRCTGFCDVEELADADGVRTEPGDGGAEGREVGGRLGDQVGGVVVCCVSGAVTAQSAQACSQPVQCGVEGGEVELV